jgi:5-formyltetrahydrofolate cyclo-ligase
MHSAQRGEEGLGLLLPSRIEFVMTSKQDLRRQARALRQTLPDIAAALVAHAPSLAIPPGSIVAGYHAYLGEADPVRLLTRLAEMGCRISFPRIVARRDSLMFHSVPEGENLQPGNFGIHEPMDHWPQIVPDVVLVPMLAFDREGNRLGYGGGFYDRTLAALPDVRAVGIAYAGQEMDSIPREPHDRALREILTEQGLRRFP